MLLLKKHGVLLQIRSKKKKKNPGKEPGTWTKLAFLIVMLKMSPE